jgi:uncharacterized metal-binding protein YceD (DUF177 family)
MPGSPASLDLRPFLHGTAQKLEWQQDVLVFDTSELEATVEACLVFTKTHAGFRVTGKLQGTAQTPCQRCNGNTDVSFEESFSEVYVIHTIGKEKDKESQIELLEEDFYEVFNPIYPFDVLDLIRQWVVVGLPAVAPCAFVETLEDAPDGCPNAVF